MAVVLLLLIFVYCYSHCSMFCCTLLYVRSSIAIILMEKRGLIALLDLSSWCLVMVERLFLAVPRGCLQFVIVVFPDHTHLLFFMETLYQHCSNYSTGLKLRPSGGMTRFSKVNIGKLLFFYLKPQRLVRETTLLD